MMSFKVNVDALLRTKILDHADCNAKMTIINSSKVIVPSTKHQDLPGFPSPIRLALLSWWPILEIQGKGTHTHIPLINS